MQLTDLNKKAVFTRVEMLVLDKKKHDRKSFTCDNAQLDKKAHDHVGFFMCA